MKTEVYNASSINTNVSSTAKAALNAPQTQPALIQAKVDIHSLVTTGFISVKDNMHLLLGTVNRQFDNPSSITNGDPVQYHTFDTVQIISTKLK